MQGPAAAALLNNNTAQPNGTHISIASEPVWNEIKNGARISDLIKTAPDDVIEFLTTHSVKRLGSFVVKHTDVLLAFGQQIILTRGSDSVHDPEYQRNWKEVIRSCAEKTSKHRRRFLEDNSWEENVTVTAYVVNIEDAAASRNNGLLSPLVQKSHTGVASNDIFDLPVVRAIIEYKWCSWARPYLIIEFVLYLGWLFSFVAFLIIYIETDLRKDFEEQSTYGRFLLVVAYMMDVLSVVLMSPFLFIEYKTICSYGLRWLQTCNLIDSIAYVLQIAVSFHHLVADEHLENKHYNTLLAVQCVLLFIKIQHFGRVFGAKTCFVDLLSRVVSKVHWFLVFIILTMVSVALSLAVLYKDDADDGLRTAGDFSNVIRSVVTTYAILLGHFETEYVFDGSNKIAKGVFLLFFQVIMSITVLNLLIAVMTESYRRVATESRIMYNVGRAQLIDELEVTLPKSWVPSLKPFCHFLVVEQTPKQQRSSRSRSPLARVLSRNNPLLSTEVVVAPLLSEIESLKTEVKTLTRNIDTLTSQFNTLVERLPPAAANAI